MHHDLAPKGAKWGCIIVEVDPKKYAHAELDGSDNACLGRLNVSLAWGRSMFHKLDGNDAATPDKIEMKWALKVRMACLAAF